MLELARCARTAGVAGTACDLFPSMDHAARHRSSSALARIGGLALLPLGASLAAYRFGWLDYHDTIRHMDRIQRSHGVIDPRCASSRSCRSGWRDVRRENRLLPLFQIDPAQPTDATLCDPQTLAR